MKIGRKRTLAYGLMFIGLLLLLSGIILSISIGAKEIDFFYDNKCYFYK